VYYRDDGSLLLVDDTAAPLPATNLGMDGPAVFPVAGDWDGDGRDTVAALRPDHDNGLPVFDLPVATSTDPEARRIIPVEAEGQVLPVAGDWDGVVEAAS